MFVFVWCTCANLIKTSVSLKKQWMFHCNWVYGPSQRELLLHPSAPIHLYKSVTNFWSDSTLASIAAKKEAGELLVDIYGQVTCAEHAAKRSAYCMIHDGECTHPRAHTHLAGIICVSWSPMGMGRGVDGRDYPLWCSWVSLRREVQESNFKPCKFYWWWCRSQCGKRNTMFLIGR